MKILNSLKSLGDGEGRRHCRSLEADTFQIAQAKQHRGGHSWDLAFGVCDLGGGLVGINDSVAWHSLIFASQSNARCFTYIQETHNT